MQFNQVRDNKLTILKNFIKNNKDLATQGSEQWVKDRQYIIGGSEIASLIGKNPFSNLQGLIAQKVNLTKFTGNAACRWGNLFENVSELLFKTMFIDSSIFNNKIYATGSIQHKTIQNHRYSPDGLCCITYVNDNVKTCKTTLLEFKSPYSSIPTAKVPTHYLPQVKAGLCTIDIAETGLFVNNMFRKCALNQLDFTLNYDTSYHRDTDAKLAGINTTIANGIIMFSISFEKLHLFTTRYNKLYNCNDVSSDLDVINITNNYADFLPDMDLSDLSDSESESDHKHYDNGSSILYKIYRNVINFQEDVRFCDKITNLRKNMIDLGIQNKQIFDQFLELYKPEENGTFINIKCIKPQINKQAMNNSSNFILPDELNYITEPVYLNNICKKYNTDKLITSFITKCVLKKEIPIAYLPYKLLRSSNIIVTKDNEFLNLIKNEIDSCISIVKHINSNSKSMDETADLFEKHFINNPITKKYYDEKPHSEEFLKDFV